MTVKQVRVEAVGGLGNQLFGYFAGLYLASRNAVPLSLDLSLTSKGMTNHGSKITDLEFPNLTVVDESKPLKEFVVKAVGFTLSKIKSVNLGVGLALEQRVGLHTSGVVGTDQELELFKGGVHLRGYFQSGFYIDELEKSGLVDFPFKPYRPSAWFTKMERLASDVRPIIVHVRRGDYAAVSDSVGMLSVDYYEHALKFIDDEIGGEKREVWVFSDDLHRAEADLSSLHRGNVKFISPDPNSTAAETMCLMSLGVGIVISNSTFSWWSARMSRGSLVVAPKPWFILGEVDDQLYPSQWKTLSSRWLKQEPK